MLASEIRAEARKSLTGKWGKAALATLVFGILTYIINFVLGLIPFVGGLVSAVISPVLSYGFLVTMMKLKRNEEVSYVGFFTDGFNSFGRVWGVVWHIFLKLIVPILLIVLPFVVLFIAGITMGLTSTSYASASTSMTLLSVICIIIYFIGLIYVIVKGYLYTLSYYILRDNENMTPKEAVEESEKLMNGHRWQYFWLQFTFIGWAILCVFTLGIGLLWLMPYIRIATVAFYESLAGTTDSTVEETVTETDPIQ